MAARAQRYRQAHDPGARSHCQLIWLLRTGPPATAGVTPDSGTWVREIGRRYRRHGPAGRGDRRHQDPGRAALLDAAGQAAPALRGAAPDGGRWPGRQVAAWMRADLGRALSPQRGWEYPRPVGFTPQPPRPTATHADPAAPAAFTTGGSPPPWPR